MPFVLKTETTTIDGLEVRTTAFPAVRQYKLMTRLGNVHGGLDVSSSNADSDAATSLMLDMLSNTEVQILEDGKPPRWVLLASQAKVDEVFSGRPFKAFMEAYAFAIKVNFGDPQDAGSAPDAPRP